MLRLDRPQMTVRGMHIARCIPNSTNTHSEYVIVIFFPPNATTVARTPLNVTLYVHRLHGYFYLALNSYVTTITGTGPGIRRFLHSRRVKVKKTVLLIPILTALQSEARGALMLRQYFSDGKSQTRAQVATML